MRQRVGGGKQSRLEGEPSPSSSLRAPQLSQCPEAPSGALVDRIKGTLAPAALPPHWGLFGDGQVRVCRATERPGDPGAGAKVATPALHWGGSPGVVSG